jgi:hypothetical protein
MDNVIAEPYIPSEMIFVELCTTQRGSQQKEVLGNVSDLRLDPT